MVPFPRCWSLASDAGSYPLTLNWIIHAENALVVRALYGKLVPLCADVLVGGELNPLGISGITQAIMHVELEVGGGGTFAQKNRPQAIVKLTLRSEIKLAGDAIERGCLN